MAGEPVAESVLRIPVDRLRRGPSPRLGPVRGEHVDALAALDGRWPPILVTRTDHTIVDGHYRYLAARKLGYRTVECVYFDGGAGPALVEAVRRNVSHGLVLSLGEREHAAAHVLGLCPDWSDRRIASLCGLSPTTVGRLRSDGRRPTVHNGQMDEGTAGSWAPERRRGRDNKSRPVDPALARQRIAEEIRANPEASLRQIARVVGSSPETVRSVRREVLASNGRHPQVVALSDYADRSEPAPHEDAALVATSEGQQFTEWFERTDLFDAQWLDHVDAVPLSRIYAISDRARRRAASWVAFAEALEARVKGRRSG